MATIYTVSDGDPADAQDLNQLVSTFNNVFGITDTAQLALGRLVLPRSVAASAPASPITGQAWFVTDEGAGGRLYLRHNTADSVAQLAVRQRKVSTDLSTATISATSYTDVGLSADIVTTGGDLKITIVPTDLSPGSKVRVDSTDNAETLLLATVRCMVGATDIGAHEIGMAGDAGSNSWFICIPASSMFWLHRPVAGSYTVKIQASVLDTTMQIRFTDCRLLVEEVSY